MFTKLTVLIGECFIRVYQSDSILQNGSKQSSLQHWCYIYLDCLAYFTKSDFKSFGCTS